MAVENNNLCGYVDERLEEWGSWARRGESGALYYSSRSNIANIANAGGVYVEANCQNDDDNPRAEEMDKLVTRMAETHKVEAKCLTAYYVQCGTNDFLARKMKMSLHTFYAKIKIGKAWLSGKLSK